MCPSCPVLYCLTLSHVSCSTISLLFPLLLISLSCPKFSSYSLTSHFLSWPFFSFLFLSLVSNSYFPLLLFVFSSTLSSVFSYFPIHFILVSCPSFSLSSSSTFFLAYYLIFPAFFSTTHFSPCLNSLISQTRSSCVVPQLSFPSLLPSLVYFLYLMYTTTIHTHTPAPLLQC